MRGRSLLKHMAPEHRFATSAKLCSEVLGGVVDGLLSMPACEEVLGDALRILASPHMKVLLTWMFAVTAHLSHPVITISICHLQ